MESSSNSPLPVSTLLNLQSKLGYLTDYLHSRWAHLHFFRSTIVSNECFSYDDRQKHNSHERVTILDVNSLRSCKSCTTFVWEMIIPINKRSWDIRPGSILWTLALLSRSIWVDWVIDRISWKRNESSNHTWRNLLHHTRNQLIKSYQISPRNVCLSKRNGSQWA